MKTKRKRKIKERFKKPEPPLVSKLLEEFGKLPGGIKITKNPHLHVPSQTEIDFRIVSLLNTTAYRTVVIDLLTQLEEAVDDVSGDEKILKERLLKAKEDYLNRVIKTLRS